MQKLNDKMDFMKKEKKWVREYGKWLKNKEGEKRNIQTEKFIATNK